MRTLSIVSIFAFLLGLASPAAAYSHSFTNQSKLPVRFWVNYASCSNDSWPSVQPGQTVTWRSGLCCISGVKVEPPAGVRGSGSKGGGTDAAAWVGSLGTVLTGGVIGYGLQCGNTNWRALLKYGNTIVVEKY